MQQVFSSPWGTNLHDIVFTRAGQKALQRSAVIIAAVQLHAYGVTSRVLENQALLHTDMITASGR